MEIIDYLRILRRHLAIVVLVPVLAAAAATGFLFMKPTQYSAIATVSSGTLVGGSASRFTGPQADNQFVAAFAATANGPRVINAVADKTGVAAGVLRDDVTVTPVGSSSNMQIAYSSKSRPTVQPVLQAMVAQTLLALFEPTATDATQQLALAQKQVDDANAALAAYAKKIGVADPAQAYQAQLNQIATLQQQQATFRANGNPVAAAGLDATIASSRTQLATYGAALAEFNGLKATQQGANDDMMNAMADQRQAQGVLSTATSTGIAFITGTGAVSKSGSVLTTVLPIFGAGIFLAILAVVILELLSGGGVRVAGKRHNKVDSPADDVPVESVPEATSAVEQVAGAPAEESTHDLTVSDSPATASAGRP